MVKQFPVFMGTVLATPVRVVNQPARRTFLCDTTKQGLADQVFGHALAHGVAHQVAAEQVFVTRQIEPSFIGRDVGDVG